MYQRIHLAMIVLLPTLSLLTLHGLRDQPWASMPVQVWKSPVTAEPFAALIRIVGMAVAGWILLTTVGYLAARALGYGRIAATIARATAPALKRLIDRAIVTTAIVGTVTASPAIAAPPPIPAPVVATQPVESPPMRTTPDLGEVRTLATYEVVKGDSFWKIAANQAPSSNITAYWLDMIELNIETIRSGNPNLIYPGELLQLPAQN